MAAPFSPQLIAQLIAEDAWISSEHRLGSDGSEAHQFLEVLWTVVADYLTEPELAHLRVAVLGARQPGIRVARSRTGDFTVLLSVALLEAALAYSRSWVVFHHPALSAVQDRTAAQAMARDNVLSLAQTYRRRGVIVVELLGATAAGAELAVARASIGLTFLLLHECAHIRSGHIPSGPTAERCLDVSVAHQREVEADRLAAEWLAANPPAGADTGESLRILFELLHLLAVGVPDSLETHPLPLERFMALAPLVSESELAGAVDALRLGRDGFWYLGGDEQR